MLNSDCIQKYVEGNKLPMPLLSCFVSCIIQLFSYTAHHWLYATLLEKQDYVLPFVLSLEQILLISV